MIVLYNGCHTSFDVMKEYMIYGAELDEKYQIPIVPACSLDYLPEDSIDFGESFSQKIKGHRKLNVNFYIDDSKFQRLWNNPDKYLEHLKCFHSVCMPDFSIATGDCGMPFALNLYNVYRNHALAHYMLLNGIRVIPSVGIPDKDNYDLCFAGYSKGGVIAVCTNGRVRAKAARIEFCEGFKVMIDMLQPHTVLIVGKIPDELNTDVKIVNYKSRNQKVNEGFSNGNKNNKITEKTETDREPEEEKRTN